MKFRFVQKRVSALARWVEPTNSSPVIDWPPAALDKPRENQILPIRKDRPKTATLRFE